MIRRLRLCRGIKSLVYHAEVVQQIITLNLTAKQVKELCESDLQENIEETNHEIKTNSAAGA